MANFTAARTGGWPTGAKLEPEEISQLQEMLLKCPNFSEGSAHSLTGTLTIGATGAGALVISAPTTHSGVTTFTGTTDTQGLELHSSEVYINPGSVTIYSYKRDIWVTSSISIVLTSGFDANIPIGAEYTIYNYGSTDTVDFKPNGNGNSVAVPKYSAVRFRKVNADNDVNSYIHVVMNSGL